MYIGLNVRFIRKLSEEANRKWHTGNRMVTWPITSRDTKRSNLNTLRAQHLENSWRCYL